MKRFTLAFLRSWVAATIGICMLIAGSTPSRSDGSGPQIGEISWHLVDSYCAFVRRGHEIDHDNPQSWRFVFLIHRATDSKVAVERGYARIDGLLRELQLVSRTVQETGEQRQYRTFGAHPTELIIEMTVIADENSQKQKKKDGGATAYTGAMLARGPLGQSRVAITGTCGPESP